MSLDLSTVRPEWHRRAACRGIGTQAFFQGTVPSVVKKLCASCPTMLECSIQGQSEPFGVWGGRSHGGRYTPYRQRVAS